MSTSRVVALEKAPEQHRPLGADGEIGGIYLALKRQANQISPFQGVARTGRVEAEIAWSTPVSPPGRPRRAAPTSRHRGQETEGRSPPAAALSLGAAAGRRSGELSSRTGRVGEARTGQLLT